MKKVFGFIKDLVLLTIIMASILYVYRKSQQFFSGDRIPLVDLNLQEYLLFGFFYVGFISILFMATGFLLNQFFEVQRFHVLVGLTCSGAFAIGFHAYVGMLAFDSFAENVRYILITLFGLVVGTILKKYLPAKKAT
jgi:hypothetical protein